MADILVIHHDNMNKRGGTEQVCINVLQAIPKEHNITLLTSRSIDLDSLFSYFGSPTKKVRIKLLNYPANIKKYNLTALLNKGYIKCFIKNKDINGLFIVLLYFTFKIIFSFCQRLGHSSQALLKVIHHKSLVQRAVRSEVKNKNFDLIINTSVDEIFLDEPIVQYIHFPYFHETFYSLPKHFQWTNKLVSRTDSELIKNDLLLANSKWTRRKICSIYPCNIRVVYPPIITAPLKHVMPRVDKTEDFIMVGRISPSKNIIRSIQIINRVRLKGFKVTLTIVGPASHQEYAKQIKSLAQRNDWITYEGKVRRHRLVHLLNTHKYGIHGHDSEHFGIVVAEMVAAEIVPFVPNGGGQTEIVNNNSSLIYDSVDDAVEKIVDVVSSEKRYASVLADLPDIQSMCGVSRFRKEVKDIIDHHLQSIDAEREAVPDE